MTAYEIHDGQTGGVIDAFETDRTEEAAEILAMYLRDGIEAELWSDAEGVWARIPEEELDI